MLHLANVDQDRKPKLSQTAQNLLRSNLANARIAVRQAIHASNATARVFLDAETVAKLAGDKEAERQLDALGAAVLTHVHALEVLKRQLDLLPVPTTSNNMTASASISALTAE